MELEEPIVKSHADEPEFATEDVMDRSRSPSVEPLTLARLVQRITPQDIFDILKSREFYTAWIDDRRCLRGIVAYHFHIDKNNCLDTNDNVESKCIYAIVDERPSRSRSKKPHTVLAIAQDYEHRRERLRNRIPILVKFPDDLEKRDSEHWSLSNRDFEFEIFARFKPYKVQHHISQKGCRLDIPREEWADPLGTKPTEKEFSKVWYGGLGRLSKEPGRDFYTNEQNGTVWQ